MQTSYWEQSTFFAPADVLIIGSGIVGLNAALYLKRKAPALRVTVIDRGVLPYGASTRNAGFACFGSPSEILADLRSHSEDEVFNLVERRWKGLLRLRENLGDDAIDYEAFGSHEVFRAEEQARYEACLEALPMLNRRLRSITGTEDNYGISSDRIAAFGFANIRHMLFNKSEGQLDTGRMMEALLEKVRGLGVRVINGLEVKALSQAETGIELSCSTGITLTARQVLLANNGFARELLPELAVVPARAQVIVTEPLPSLPFRGCFHYDEGYYYFRNIGNRILLGGGRNLDIEGETTTEMALTARIQEALDELLLQTIAPGLRPRVAMRWSGIMGVGPQKSPILRQVLPGVFTAVRMGGMGVAIGSLVGEEAAELLLQHR
jgi:hypothetical protein